MKTAMSFQRIENLRIVMKQFLQSWPPGQLFIRILQYKQNLAKIDIES